MLKIRSEPASYAQIIRLLRMVKIKHPKAVGERGKPLEGHALVHFHTNRHDCEGKIMKKIYILVKIIAAGEQQLQVKEKPNLSSHGREIKPQYF